MLCLIMCNMLSHILVYVFQLMVYDKKFAYMIFILSLNNNK
jgi:hypothetical protein